METYVSKEGTKGESEFEPSPNVFGVRKRKRLNNREGEKY